ncbi:MAG: hypothetical protein ACREDW_05305 [Aestuariivirgaceae bacterium]
MYSRLVVALSAILLMTSSSHAGTRLSAAEINALAPGDYVGTWKGKRKLHLTLNSNGTISGSVDGFRYRGNWYVSGQSLCVGFKIMSAAKTKCGDIRRQGAWLVGYSNKKGEPRIRIRAASGTVDVAKN